MSRPLTQYERDDPGFVEDLRASESAVWRVARWLHARGTNVTIRPLRIRERVEDMADFADVGDLEVIQRVEVKQRNLAFTNRGDFPFPTMIVDVAHTWDRAKPKPYAYLILNQTGTVAAIVKGSTCSHWRRVERWDAAKRRSRTFYECPLDCVVFTPLETGP